MKHVKRWLCAVLAFVVIATSCLSDAGLTMVYASSLSTNIQAAGNDSAQPERNNPSPTESEEQVEEEGVSVEASVEDVHDKFFRIWCEPVTHKFWKGWKKNCMQTDEQVDALEEQIDDFYVNVIQDAKTPADIMNGMLAL